MERKGPGLGGMQAVPMRIERKGPGRAGGSSRCAGRRRVGGAHRRLGACPLPPGASPVGPRAESPWLRGSASRSAAHSLGQRTEGGEALCPWGGRKETHTRGVGGGRGAAPTHSPPAPPPPALRGLLRPRRPCPDAPPRRLRWDRLAAGLCPSGLEGPGRQAVLWGCPPAPLCSSVKGVTAPAFQSRQDGLLLLPNREQDPWREGSEEAPPGRGAPAARGLPPPPEPPPADLLPAPESGR